MIFRLLYEEAEGRDSRTKGARRGGTVLSVGKEAMIGGRRAQRSVRGRGNESVQLGRGREEGGAAKRAKKEKKARGGV